MTGCAGDPGTSSPCRTGLEAETELAGLSELRFYDLTRSGAVSGGSDSVAVGSRMTVAHSKSDIYPLVLSRWLLLTF